MSLDNPAVLLDYIIQSIYQVFVANRIQHIARRRLGVYRAHILHSAVHGTAETLMNTIDYAMLEIRPETPAD